MTSRRGLLGASALASAAALLRRDTAAFAAPLDVAPPPPPGPGGQLVCVPLGDSITYGSTNDTANGGNGYRKYLLDNILGPNETHAFSYAGSVISGTANLPHEGHPGESIGQLISRVQGGCLANPAPQHVGPPQFVVLLAGVNDFGYPNYRTYQQGLQDTSALLDVILSVSPTLCVVLCEQILCSGSVSHDLTDNTRKQQAYNDGLPDLVATKGGRVVIARTGVIRQQSLDASGVHPTDAGYQQMAYQIYRAFAPWLGSEGKYMVNVSCPFPAIP